MQNISFHCWFGDRQKWYAAGRIPSAKKKDSVPGGVLTLLLTDGICSSWVHQASQKNSFVHDISNGDLKTTISCQSAFLSGMRFWRNSRISFQVRLLYLNYVNGSQAFMNVLLVSFFSLFNCDLQDVVNMQQGVCVYVHLLLSLHTHLVWKHGAFNLWQSAEVPTITYLLFSISYFFFFFPLCHKAKEVMKA